MNVFKRLTRKPLNTMLWFLIVVFMTGFLNVGVTLNFSSSKLARELDSRHTAIAVRTDPAAVEVDGEYVVERRFTQADADAIAAFDSVKAVRSHPLSGASSPSFMPVTDINKHMSWYAPGEVRPYYNIVISGTVGAVKLFEDGMLFVAVNTEEVLLVSDGHSQVGPLLKYIGVFAAAIDAGECPEAADYFVEGERYVFNGVFDPFHSRTDQRVQRLIHGEGYYAVYTLDLGKAFMQDGCLMGIPQSVYGELQGIGGEVPFSYPAADRIDCEPAEFFDKTPHEIWRKYRGAWEKQNHGVPAIGTDELEALFVFVNGDAELIEGRSFTPEEYESGARAVIISERIANNGGISVGDRIPICQFSVGGSGIKSANYSTRADLGETLMNPNIDLLNMYAEYSEAEEFEVVGIYRLRAEWSYSTYSITPNTVFIPRSAQTDGAFCTIPRANEDPAGTTDVYGPYLSVELVNGSVEDFRLELSKSPYAGQFYSFDQGFEAVQKNLNGLASTSSRLMWISAAGWLFFLVLFLLMYQGGQRRNLGLLRSLGKTPGQAAFYLAGSGFITALAGVTVGTAASSIALNAVQANIFRSAVESIETVENAAIDSELLSELISASMPKLSSLIAFGAVQLGLMALLMIIQAILLSRRSPRELSAS